MEVGNTFRRLEEVETYISELQLKEDRERGLSDANIVDLWDRLVLHYFLKLARDYLALEVESLVAEEG